jgi:hypothetical protein
MSENNNYLILRVPKRPDMTQKLELNGNQGDQVGFLQVIFVRRDPDDNVMETWIPWV